MKNDKNCGGIKPPVKKEPNPAKKKGKKTAK